jgi:hypothetical protein
MSTLQHINSSINHHWPELSRRYPGFEKPQIVPAATLRGLAPTYLKSAIDSDPDSYFLFIAGDVTKGDCRRETACQFFDELFYDKLGMPSSYDIQAGGQYERAEAIDHEVLPPADNRQFQSYYDEQMERARAMEQNGGDTGAANNNDDDVIDVELGADGTYQSVADRSRSERAVGQASSTAVGMPRKIFFCVDFHCGSNAMLGYNRGENRLHGRRASGFLREEGETNAEFAERQSIAQMAECGLTEEEPVNEELYNSDYVGLNGMKEIAAALREIATAIRQSKLSEEEPVNEELYSSDYVGLNGMKEIAAALREIATAIRQSKLSEEDKKTIIDECDAVKAECEKCGDPACKDGEICGLKEELKFEKDLLGRPVIAEKQKRKKFYSDRIRALRRKRLANAPDVSGRYVFSANVDFLNLTGTDWYNQNKDQFSKFEWKGNMLDRCDDTFAFSFNYEPTYKEITDKLAQLCKAKWGIAPYEKVEDECAVSTIAADNLNDGDVITDDPDFAEDMASNGNPCHLYPDENSADYILYTAKGDKVPHVVDGKSGINKQPNRIKLGLKENDLDEFEPEEDGSEYYGKVMEKVEAIVDDEVCEEDDIDECDITEMIELGKKIR